MRDIRIGNDFTIKWSLYKNDGETRTPYEVTGAAVLKLCSAYGTREVYGWQASGNTIVWTFRGADQRHLGPYQLVYIENEGTPNMMTVDTCDAFCLVSQSCQQSDPSELLMLESDIVFAEVRMIDDELSATSPNAISNRAVTEALGKKVDAVPGKGLSTEDFTTADKTKLQSLENYNDAGIREALNEKQDAIPDLETIREGAQKGATALQEHQDISHLATKQEVEDKLKKKADTEGSYPLMSVGYSADLLGRGESVPAEFSFRASGGKSIKDGTAWIKRLKGNSVVWNQTFKKGAIRNDAGATQYFDEATGEMVIDGTITNGTQYSGSKAYGAEYATLIKGNRYLTIIRITSGEYQGSTSWLSYNGVIVNLSSMRESVAFSTYNGDIDYSVITFNVGDIFDNLRYSILSYNLTKMFGEGNEPTTIEEFYSRCPIGIDMNAYNEGEVIHCNTESIKSVGDNAWDEEWITGRLNTNTGQLNLGKNGITSKNYIRVLPNETYYCGYNAAPIFAMFYDAEYNLILQVSGSNNLINIRNRQFTTPANAVYMRFYVADNNITTYNHDIMISLVHSGWKQDTDAGYQPYWQDILPLPIIRKYFPDGMKKAGSAHDEIRFNKASGKWEAVQRIGKVDMGDMAWSKYGSGFSSESLEHLAKAPTTAGSPSPIICGKYSTQNAGHSTSWADTDKVCYMSYDGRGVVYVNDSSYTDAASFKAAMAGVPLYYELAEPTIIEYDEPFNLDYQVADFGTEQAIGSTPSAPISADIIYQFNAVDMIREHEIEINELKNLIAEMQTKLNSLS